MSSKGEFQHQLNAIGYELSPFTSKETLSNIIRLHSLVLTDSNINVAELNDVELRRSLTRHDILVGPVTNHTRSIYQRKLLEILTNETTEGEEYESDESPLDIDDENRLYPNLPDKKSFSYGLRDTYDEPLIIRHDYKASRSSKDTLTRNSYSDRNLHDNSNEIRPRITKKSTEQSSSPKVNKKSTPEKVKDDDKLQVATKSGGTLFYAGITVIVALIVFFFTFGLKNDI